MNAIDKILQTNSNFIKMSHAAVDKIPQWHMAVVTCMDTRLVGLLEPAMGIKRGDVKIIKTAGNVVSKGLNDVIKSLMVCVYELEVQEITVVGHYSCGMEKTTSYSLAEHMKECGIKEDIINGALPQLEDWADNFCQPRQNVIDSVNNIKSSIYLPDNIPVHGFVIDPDTGRLDLVINGYTLDK